MAVAVAEVRPRVAAVAVVAVVAEAMRVEAAQALVARVAMPTKVTLAMLAVAAKRNHAAIYPLLSKLFVAQASARRAATEVVTVAVTAALSTRAQAHHAPAQVVNRTQCAPVST